MIHVNSKEAYKSIMHDGSKDCRVRAILEIIQRSSKPLSDYQILQKFKSGSDNLNLCRPRITELHQSGILTEGAPIKSHDGARNVRTSFIRAGVAELQQVEMFI